MNKLFTLLLLCILGVPAAFPQCAEVEEPKVLLVGDSWAFFMNVDQTFNTIFKKWGHSDHKYYTNLVLSENGAETDDFLLPSKQAEIATQLNAHPSIKAVHLSIGGNDVLGDWNVDYTPEQTDSLKDAVRGRLISIIDFIKSVRPGIRIVWSGYAFPNFGEVIASAAPFQTSHPFYGTWAGMGFPSFLQINTLLNDFSAEIEAYAAADPQVEFVNATGLMQYTYGQNAPLGVAPGGTYPPYTVPLPHGNPEYPSPKNSMRDYGITKDCFHLSPGGYRDLIDYQTQKFYHHFLMNDLYLLSENGPRTGSVSSSGQVSASLLMGESGGEAFSTVLSFDTRSMPDTVLAKASLFLRRESLSGANPVGNNLRIRVASGYFGSSAEVEAADYDAPGNASGTPCLFGSNAGDGHWIRLDLPPQLLPYINRNAVTQFIVSAPGASGAKVTFSGTPDPEFAPVLDLTYGVSQASVQETGTGGADVYPNPTTGMLNIDVKGAAVTDLEVRDLYGKTVWRTQDHQNTIDLSSLPAGHYTVGVNTAAGRIVRRIVKL